VPLDCQRPSALPAFLNFDWTLLGRVDRHFIGVRELCVMMLSKEIGPILKKIDLMPTEAMCVFQNLNSVALGRVKVTDFIEGLIRMKQPEIGIDIAGAKSLMRRFILEIKQLCTDCTNASTCFSSTICRLRHVKVVDPTEFPDFEQDDAADEGKIKKKKEVSCAALERMYERELICLRIKIDNLREHVRERQRLVGCPGGDEAIETQSVTSAAEGWD